MTGKGVINFLVQKFFDDKRYDLGRAGRFKYTVKLGIYSRLVGRILAEDLVNDDGTIFTNNDGEPLIKGHALSKEDVQELRDAEFFEHKFSMVSGEGRLCDRSFTFCVKPCQQNAGFNLS